MDDKKIDFLKEHGVLNPHPETVLYEHFQNDNFFDPRDLLQVKYEMLRRVIKESYSVAEASQLFGFSRPTFYQVKRAFDEGGLPGLLPRQRGPKAAHKLDDAVMLFVEQALRQDSSLRPKDLVELIESRFGLTVHPRSIERAFERRKKNSGSQVDFQP